VAKDNEMQAVRERDGAGVARACEGIPASGWRPWILSILVAILLSVAVTWVLGGK